MKPEQHLGRLRDIAQQRQQVAAAEPDAIVAALRAGLDQKDVAEAAGRTREHVRRIARANGIDGSRKNPPAAQPKRNQEDR